MVLQHGKISADRYRDIRLSLNMSQRLLAEALGVHAMTISKRERGETPITREAELALRMLELEQKYDLEVVK